MVVADSGRLPPVHVRVHAAAEGPKIGMGFLIDERHILTCAHVVYNGGWVAPGASVVGRTVRLTVEGQDAPTDASIVFLSPASSEGKIDAVDDVCILELTAPIESFDPDAYPLVIREGFPNLSVRMLGIPENAQTSGLPVFAKTEETDITRRRVFLRTDGASKIEPGFSGTPVIRTDCSDVLGMVVARRGSGGLSYMLPVAVIVDIVRETLPAFPFELRLQQERDYPHISELRQHAHGFLKREIRTVVVPMHAALCPSYEQLTQLHRGVESGIERLTPAELLTTKASKTYIQAPGGSGKTAYLMQLMLRAISRGHIPFYLDGRKAGELPADAEEAVEAFFRRCTQGGGSYEVFKSVGSERQHHRMLIVDGLNENLQALKRVRDVLDDVARNNTKISIYAADRMTGASALPEGFDRATILPLDLSAITDEKIARALAAVESEKFRKLLMMPFFLDLYAGLLRGGTSGPEVRRGRAGMLNAFFAKRLQDPTATATSQPDTSGTIAALGRAAFEAYATKDQGLRIIRSTLEQKVTRVVVDRLLDAGVLFEDEQTVSFRHQLLHDYLVAVHLRNLGKAEWRARSFDAATFQATSFEAIEFASELLGNEADEFIIEVYDWSYSAALDCILNLEAGVAGQDSPVTQALRDAVLALSAEKRFDYFQHTRNKAEKKAEQYSAEFGVNYAKLESRADLVESVRVRFASEAGQSMLARWRDLFCSDTAPGPADWALLQDIPLLAWTAANTFRRHMGQSDGLIVHLCRLYEALRRAQPMDDRARTTRWRIVHALGTAETVMAQKLLTGVVRDADEYEWVRYGAVRSLVEAASRCADAAQARPLLDALVQEIPNLCDSKAFGEVRDVALIAQDQPGWWPTEYARVLESGIAQLQKMKRDAADDAAGGRVALQISVWSGQLKKLQP